MVYAAVEKGAVVGNKKKSVFLIEIAAHQLPPLQIQVIRRLIDQEEIVLRGKQDRKLQFRLLAAAEGGIGAVQHRLVQPQSRHFALQAPEFIRRIHLLRGLDRQGLRTLHGKRKIGKRHACGDRPLIGKLPQKQAEKGRLPSPVASGEAQLPVRVDLKADVIKDGLIAAVIGKTQIVYLNQ